MAQRLQQAVRAGDLVSRLGGDEFVVILRDIKTGEQARWQVEQRLIPLVRQTHSVQGTCSECVVQRWHCGLSG